MKYIALLLTIFFYTSLLGQVKQLEKQKYIHSNEVIGWQMEIPKNWDIITNEENREKHEQFLHYDEAWPKKKEKFPGFDDFQIGFKKDPLNQFQSVAKPFAYEKDGNWEEMNQASKESLFRSIEQAGIKIDSTATKLVKIDDVEFHSYEFTVQSLRTYNLLIYRSLIKGYDLGIHINYDNETLKQEMVDAWLNSTFKRD